MTSRPSPSRIVVALGFALLWLAPHLAEAGPWMPGRWRFYAQLRQSVLFADQRYDARGDLQVVKRVVDDTGRTASTSYREALTDVFVEVGVATRLSLLADFRALSAIVQPSYGLPSRSAVGLSDLWLAAKLLLFDDELTAAFQFGLWIPTGAATAEVPLGQGDLGADLTLLVGKLFEHPDVFVSAEAGLKLRGSGTVTDPRAPGRTTLVQYSHELRIAAAAGYTFRPGRPLLRAFLISAKLEAAYAFAAPVEDGLGIVTSPTISFVKIGPELVWSPTDRLHVSLGGHYFVAGRSTPAVGEIAVAVGVSR